MEERRGFHPYGVGSWQGAPGRYPLDSARGGAGPEGPPERRRRPFLAALVAGIIGGLAGAAAVAALFVARPDLVPVPTVQVSIETTGVIQPIAAVAEKVVPSVVNIATQQAFVNRFTGAVTLRDIGNGSGVVFREDGYIVTNNHVIEGADRIIVTVGVEDLEAEVVGTDPTSDLAVLKVDREGLPAAEFGDSSSLRVGDYVVAVGSPFGLDRSVTAGIVSALSRSSLSFDQSGVTAYTNLIQTDAAINPGNSGGALVDMSGKVVGINTLIESPSGAVGAPQSAGIGFAIPSDYVVEAAEQLIENGCVVHPYLGVSTATLDEATILRFGLPVEGGAVVQYVTPDSPADEAGIRTGDIIVRIGDRDIRGFGDVFTAIRSYDVGDTVEIELVRDGRRRVTVEATLIADTACEVRR
ncbi:MAG: trypsin-like peptidase domain-containing protein [Coriobacteriia bacterium]